MQWLLARRISSRGAFTREAFTRDRPDGGSLAGRSRPPGRRHGPRAVASPAGGCTSAPSAGTTPGDDVPSSPGTGGAAKSQPRIKSGGGKDADRLRLWWLGRGGAHRLPSRARSAAWPSPPPSSSSSCGGFLRGASQATGLACDRPASGSPSGLSRPSARARAPAIGAEGCRYDITWSRPRGRGRVQGRVNRYTSMIPFPLSLSSPRRRIERCRAQLLQHQAAHVVGVAVCAEDEGRASCSSLFPISR